MSDKFISRYMIAILCAVIAVSMGCASEAIAKGPEKPPVYVPNELIIITSTSDQEVVADLAANLGAEIVRPIALTNTYLISKGHGGRQTTSVPAKFRSLSKTRMKVPSPAYIQHMQPNFVVSSLEVPNDADYDNKQWHLKQIFMPEAWDIEKGSEDIIVAVLDTGVAYNHPDLDDRCISGYDFIEDDDDPNDVQGHGTHVAGTIAAETNNTIGVAGVAWEDVKIMPVRVLGDDGSGSTAGIIDGMDYAMTNGADVVNMSLGSPRYTWNEVEHAKVREMVNAGVVVVCAAGNDGNTLMPEVGVPAAYPEAIAVASVGPDDAIAYYSSYGPGNEVDIAAPGGDSRKQDSKGNQALVWSTTQAWEGGVQTFSYGGNQGTSMAAPHVAGAAALLLSAGYEPSAVRSQLIDNARMPAASLYERKKYGAGILDVVSALSAASVDIQKPVSGETISTDPLISIEFLWVTEDTIKVFFDYADANGDGIPDNISSEIPVIDSANIDDYYDSEEGIVSFKYSDIKSSGFSSGKHSIYAMATGSKLGTTVSDWAAFYTADKLFERGTHFVALPYNLAVENVDGTFTITSTPSAIIEDSSGNPVTFGTGRASLSRWLPTAESYVTYGTNDLCWLDPFSGGLPTGGSFPVVNEQDYYFPSGSGFWMTVSSNVYINGSMPVINAPRGVGTYLYNGWNMVGNPFDTEVPWRSAIFKYKGHIKSLDEAVDAKWIRPQIYSYDQSSGYRLVSYRDLLQPYSGYWVNARVGTLSEPVVMIVLP